MSTILEIENLTVGFGDAAPVLDDVSLDVASGEVLALVGESGSGKSMTALSVSRLLPRGARQRAGTVTVAGVDVGNCSERELNRVRGGKIGMLFQQPQRMLDPTSTVAQQVAEPLRRHLGLSGRSAHQRVLELLADVGIAEPERRAGSYAHQLSGGIAQRVMIATALAGEPDLLIADEPTTALDVTVEVQILQLLAAKRAQLGMSMLFISHDLGVVSSIADRVAVMYAGRIVEEGSVDRILNRPRHPYTQALIKCSTLAQEKDGSLYVIPGEVVSTRELQAGCRFAPRCALALSGSMGDCCTTEEPELAAIDADGAARCWATIERRPA